MSPTGSNSISAWFAGPKAENGEWFAETIRRTVQDYHAWRRNYFPEDGVVVDSTMRRQNEVFRDAFEDRFTELLARLKADFPFHSPRYAAHMLAEQTLPSMAGYFAAMLYNPNNISTEAAPVTVRLEVEAAQLIARMLGYGPASWGHLTGGGTVANIEALWLARTVKYLPLVVADVRRELGLEELPGLDSGSSPLARIRRGPGVALGDLARSIADAQSVLGATAETARLVDRTVRSSAWNIGTRGLASVLDRLGSAPAVIVPETHHYCFEKAVDALGLGRDSLVCVPVDPDFRMDVGELEGTLDRVRGEGRHVLAVIAVVGTTEEGAVDPVDRIAALRDARSGVGGCGTEADSFWLHADAAYGGYLRTITLPERLGLGEPTADVKVGGREVRIPLRLPEHGPCDALERLGECDSVTIDPHKLGYIPYPAGAVCFKSDLVKLVARQDAPYLAESPGEAAGDSASDGVGMYILEGSKPGAAAAAVWLSHTLIPLDNTGHGVLVRETIRNACELHSLLVGYPAHVPGVGVRAVPLCDPGSNIVCYAFRAADRDLPLSELNRLNRRIYERFTLRVGERVYDQSFFVSRTTLSPDRYGLRACGPFLDRLGAAPEDYSHLGVFLLRSVLMNPWYSHAKRRGRYFLSELVADLHGVAEEEFANPTPRAPSPSAAAIVRPH